MAALPPLPRGIATLRDRVVAEDLALTRSKTADDYVTKGAMAKTLESGSPPKTHEAAVKLASILSPCYLHRRFDDAVDIEKVLEEIAGDESMSHSRLVQTATGVREVSKQLQRRPIKRAVRNVVIITKARDNHLVLLTRQLAEWLLSTPRYSSSLGVNVYVDAKLRDSKRFGADELVAKEPRFESMLRYWTPELCWSTPEKFDLVLTLGGDGTVLFTSWLFQRIVPPILSFSLGSLGFLTPFDFQHYRENLNRVMGGLQAPASNPSPSPPLTTPREILGTIGRFPSRSSTGSSSPLTSAPGDVVPDAGMRVNLRMRFTCTVHRVPKRHRSSSNASASRISTPSLSTSSTLTATESSASSVSGAPNADSSSQVTQFEVLNEIVIDRGPSPYVSNLELFGDDALLTVIQADGCIFSTPTGSTAYSLSAGGSLVHPSIPAILLTPICPHTLSFRPMLLNDTMSLRVAVPRGSRAGAWCSFDGKGRIELRQGDYVTIRASRYPFATVVADAGDGWIDSVSRTLRWNTREARQKSWSSARGRGGGRRLGSLSLADPSSAPDKISEHLDEDTVEESEFDGDDDDGDGGEGEFDIDFDDDDDSTSLPRSSYEGGGAGSATMSNPPSGSVEPLSARKPASMPDLTL